MTFILHIYASGRFIWRKELDECFSYVHKDFFTSLEAAMDAAILELKRFGEKCKHLEYLWRSWLTSIWIALPTLLADKEERATTRYINITTIATFFSSVAATTLQFTFGQSSSGSSDYLRGVVNLFWFLSLIFSVSAGVNSLLGMTWRKSSVYVTRHSCGLKILIPSSDIMHVPLPNLSYCGSTRLPWSFLSLPLSHLSSVWTCLYTNPFRWAFKYTVSEIY